MVYSLEEHVRDYTLSVGEIAFSVCTLSGIPYAIRHWELSNQFEGAHWLGHRVIACVEAIPVIGGIAALIESLVMKIFSEKKPDEIVIYLEQDFLEKIEKMNREKKTSVNTLYDFSYPWVFVNPEVGKLICDKFYSWQEGTSTPSTTAQRKFILNASEATLFEKKWQSLKHGFHSKVKGGLEFTSRPIHTEWVENISPIIEKIERAVT